MADNFDIFLAFQLDEAANKRVESGISTVQEEMDRIAKSMGMAAKGADLFNNATNRLVKSEEKLTPTAKAVNKEIDTQTRGFSKLAKLTREAESTTVSYTQEQKRLRVESKATAETLKFLSTQQAILNKQDGAASRGAGILNSFGNKSTLAGVGIIGGILAESTAYSKKMGDATNETRQFNDELDKLSSARGRIDAVLTAQVLPILQMASKVANITAGIIEKNPQLASFALKGGALLIGIGTLAKLAGTGLKLYADATFFTAQGIGLEAARLQLTASTNQLLAAGKQSGGQIAQGLRGALGVGAPAAAGVGGLGVAGQAGILIAAPIIAGILTKEVANALQKAMGMKESTWSDIGKTYIQLVELPTKLLLVTFKGMGLISGETAKKLNMLQNQIFDFANVVDEASKKLGAAGDSSPLDNSNLKANGPALVSAFSDMNKGLLESQRNYDAQRKSILEDSNASLLSSARNNARSIQSINDRALSSRNSIITNFANASRQAEQKLAEDRAQILRDTSQEIQQIEADRLEKIREITQDHADRENDLKANRDALGLVLEQRNFERQKEEVNTQANREIAQRRQDLALKLQDLTRQAAIERAQRLAAYQQDLKDNEAARLEALKVQRDQFIEERRQIAENRNARLRDLLTQNNEERQRIRQGFIDKVRDLDAALLGEQQTKRQAYTAMLGDVTKFLADWRARMSSTRSSGAGAIPSFAEGGHVPDGLIRSHKGEFMANRDTTRQLESLLGRRLSQQALLESAARGAMVYNDQSNYSGVTVADMKRIRQRSRLESLRAMEDVFSS